MGVVRYSNIPLQPLNPPPRNAALATTRFHSCRRAVDGNTGQLMLVVRVIGIEEEAQAKRRKKKVPQISFYGGAVFRLESLR